MPASGMNKRFITTHDDAGNAVFVPTDHISEDMPWDDVGPDKNYALAYTTGTFPIKMDQEEDVKQYAHMLENKPGMVIHGGTILRYVDYGPGVYSPMHRTVSLDYGVVVQGQIELELDSGQKRTMKHGDISIMRGTRHSWRNKSQTDWARILFVLMHAEAPTIAGQELSEDYGKNMQGIRASS